MLPGRAEAISSIAVLPFENRTGDEGKEYFVDGATDEVITQLGKIGAWRVISRTSAMHYKRAVKSLSEIAGELNVDAVVEGTVYQIGENVRIGVRLIDVLPEEKNLWADIYDRPKTDVRIIYSEMARTIADKTQVNLTAEEITRLTSASQVNSESYDNYLKGRSHWLRFTSAEFKLALQYFDLALQIDPNNSLAHLGVAQVWGSRYQVGYATRDEAYPILNSSAQKALELDNTLAEAHYWLAGIRGWGEWDWKGAETGFLQAFKLNPNFPDVYAWYSHLLSHLGRADEALSYIGRALELDPLNPTFQALYGVVLIYNRRFDEAITAARKVLEMEPLHPIAQGAMHWALLANGKYEELLAYYREKRYANRPKWVAALDVGFEKAGYSGAFRTLADMMVEWYKSQARAVKAMGISDKYLEAGDLDLAIDWLEKAYEDHDMSLPYIGIPAYDPLRSDPRFQELLRKMNLPVDEKK